MQNPNEAKTKEEAKAQKQHHFVVRMLFLCGGLIAVGLGLIGVIVPGLPSVVFFLIAVFCFARSSPRLERWILEHPRFGASVVAYLDHGMISKKSKIIAVMMIALSYIILSTFTHAPILVKIGVGIVLIGVIIFILTCPSSVKEEGEK